MWNNSSIAEKQWLVICYTPYCVGYELINILINNVTGISEYVALNGMTVSG